MQNPISGAEITAYLWDATKGVSTSSYGPATSLQNGDFSIAGLEPGQYKVRIEAEGYTHIYLGGGTTVTSDADTVFSLPAGSSVSVGAVTLDAGGALSGTITDAAGNPLVDAWVVGYQWNSAEDGELDQYDTRTDDAGVYSLKGLPKGYYRVGAYAPNGSNAITGFYGGGRSRFDDTVNSFFLTQGATKSIGALALDAGATVRGTVTDASGTPIEDATVTIYPWDAAVQSVGAELAEVSTDFDGTYSTTSLPAGTCVIRVKADGHPAVWVGGGSTSTDSATTKFTLVSGQTASAGVTQVTDGGGITGTLLNASGAPVTGAYVYALAWDESEQSWHGEDGLNFPDRTDDSGTFSLEVLVPGTYKVKVDSHGYPTQFLGGGYESSDLESLSITVSKSGTTALGPVSLASGGTLTGALFDVSGRAIQDSRVQVARVLENGSDSSDADVNADGTFTTAGLRPGRYIVTGAAPGYLPAYAGGGDTNLDAMTFTVAEGSTGSVGDIVLDQAAIIRGTVTASDGSALRGVEVTTFARYSSGWDDQDSEWTATDGSWSFDDLKSGSYKIRFRLAGYATTFYGGGSSPADSTSTLLALTQGAEPTLLGTQVMTRASDGSSPSPSPAPETSPGPGPSAGSPAPSAGNGAATGGNSSPAGSGTATGASGSSQPQAATSPAASGSATDATTTAGKSAATRAAVAKTAKVSAPKSVRKGVTAIVKVTAGAKAVGSNVIITRGGKKVGSAKVGKNGVALVKVSTKKFAKGKNVLSAKVAATKNAKASAKKSVVVKVK